MIYTYQKKPVRIAALQYKGIINDDTLRSFIPFLTHELSIRDCTTYAYSKNIDNKDELFIKTLEGDMRVSKNDYIIKGVDGEFYSCKPDIFKKSYELCAT